MKKITVTDEYTGQRLDKFLKRLLPSCPGSLLYKQLRKKNITLNGKKADGSESVMEGDTVEVFFSDETFDKFSQGEKQNTTRYLNAYRSMRKIDVVTEKEDFIIFNKPEGILSQGDNSGAYSINDYLIGYLLENGEITGESLNTVKPSVCNRLDRNTSGLIICSKNLKGARLVNTFFHDRDVTKYYLALCCGRFNKEGDLKAFVKKDEKENKLLFTTEDDCDAMEIRNGFEVIESTDDLSLLKIHLYTGKSHQIRAHLSHMGFPITGDPKYGGNNGKYRAKRQMLHAYSLQIGGDSFTAPMPADMLSVCKKEFGSDWELNI
jgi:23S rRNA pseudouridine955/2504/2580 synthase